jgi:hypothetical protein
MVKINQLNQIGIDKQLITGIFCNYLTPVSISTPPRPARIHRQGLFKTRNMLGRGLLITAIYLHSGFNIVKFIHYSGCKFCQLCINLFKSLLSFVSAVETTRKIRIIFVGVQKQARSSLQQDRATYFQINID